MSLKVTNYQIVFRKHYDGVGENKKLITEECGISEKATRKLFKRRFKKAKILRMKEMETFECPESLAGQYS